MPNNRLITRRQALWLGLGGMTTIGAIATNTDVQARTTILSLNNPNRDFSVIGSASLKQRAAAKGLIYGSAGTWNRLSKDASFAASFAQQCGILVPEGELKFNWLRPTQYSFNFTAGDQLLNFARTRGMLFRGHTLVWRSSLPQWFSQVVNRQNGEQFLVQHINTVVRHYAGKVHSWDVVNEAISTVVTNRQDALMISPWLQFVGENYIELAFRTAAAADPQAMLVYNDRYLDYDTSRDNAQREAVLKLLQRLKYRGTPIHALGIQAHLRGSETRFNPTKFRNFLKDVASLGLKILITELDVNDQNLPVDFYDRDRIVAGVYEDYLSAALDERAVIAVLTWGLSDRYTWLSEYAPRADKLPVRTLPLDSNLQPKLAWNAIARAFDNAPKR